MTDAATPYDYQSEGGALLLDAPTYVKRQADDDLYAGLKAGQFCYVLNARQMGKSSLKVRTLQRLRDEGIACAAVDLQGIGTSATEEQWYFGIISRIARSLGLHRQFNLNTWWTEQPRLSYVQRFVEFLESLLLPAVAEPIVIFIDEVDLTLNLAFRDDFFGALRESYNRRADEPEYRRLTFALFGVTTPSDLIQNKQTTPFNIGRPVDLTGFQLAEAQPLMTGLVAKAHNPQALLQAVLDWTGGQPFLTQKLCKLVQSAESAPTDGQESQWVEQLVQAKVIDNWEAQDIPPHLKTIRDRLLLSGEQRTGRLLGLYQQIVQQGELAADDSPEQVELRLTGLVVKRDGKLRVYNRIYEQVFNRDWLERSLAELRPYGGAIAAWLESGHQDESRLLRGQALQDARTWAEGKSLGDDDRRFLDASQELEKQDIQKQLATEEKAKQVLAEANREAKRKILIGSFVLGTTLLATLGAFALAGWQSTKAEQSRQEVEAAKQQVKEAQDKVSKSDQEAKNAEERKKRSEQNLAIAKKQEEQTRQQYQQAQRKIIAAQNQLAQVNQDKETATQQAAIAKQQEVTAKKELKIAEDAITKAKQKVALSQASNIAISADLLQSKFKALEAGQIETQLALLKLVTEWQMLVEDSNFSQFKLPIGIDIASNLNYAFHAVRSKMYEMRQRFVKFEKEGIFYAAFSPSGNYFATAGDDGVVKLWNTVGKQYGQIKTTSVYQLSLSEQCLATIEESGIKLWQYSKSAITPTGELGDSEEKFVSAHFSRDGKALITTSVQTDKKLSNLKIWNIENCQHRGERQLAQTENDFFGASETSPDGSKVLIEVWKVHGKDPGLDRIEIRSLTGALLNTLPNDWTKLNSNNPTINYLKDCLADSRCRNTNLFGSPTVKFLSEGSLIFGDFNKLYQVDIAQGKLLFSLDRNPEGHQDNKSKRTPIFQINFKKSHVFMTRIVPLPNYPSRFISSSPHGKLSLWQTPSEPPFDKPLINEFAIGEGIFDIKIRYLVTARERAY